MSETLSDETASAYAYRECLHSAGGSLTETLGGITYYAYVTMRGYCYENREQWDYRLVASNERGETLSECYGSDLRTGAGASPDGREMLGTLGSFLGAWCEAMSSTYEDSENRDLFALDYESASDWDSFACSLSMLGESESDPDYWVCSDCLNETANGTSTRTENLEPGFPYYSDEYENELRAAREFDASHPHCAPSDHECAFSHARCDRCDALAGSRYGLSEFTPGERAECYCRESIY